MTAKSQELYQEVLEKLREKIPHFQPQVAMSDWEHAARNAFKKSTLKSNFMGVGFISLSAFGQKRKKHGLSLSLLVIRKIY